MGLSAQIETFLYKSDVSPYLQVFVCNGTISDVIDAACRAESAEMGKKWVWLSAAIAYSSTALCSIARAARDLALAILSLFCCPFHVEAKKICKTHLQRTVVHLMGIAVGLIGTLYPKGPLLLASWILHKTQRLPTESANLLVSIVQTIQMKESRLGPILHFYRQAVTIDLFDAAHRVKNPGLGRRWTWIDSATAYSFTTICSGIRLIQDFIIIGLLTLTHPYKKEIPSRKAYWEHAQSNFIGIKNGLNGTLSPQSARSKGDTAENSFTRLLEGDPTLKLILGTKDAFEALSMTFIRMLPPL